MKNKKRLLEDCHKKVDGARTRKTKTTRIVDEIEDDNYQRQPAQELLSLNKQETKTVMIARFGMLECGINFKGTLKEVCKSCKKRDDENHRLNYCKRYKELNLANADIKTEFHLIFSKEVKTLRTIIPLIERVWNTRNANGTMLKP